MSTDPVKNAVLRRWYFACILLAAGVLVVVRFALIPVLSPTPRFAPLDIAAQLADSLLAATIASFVVSVLVIWLGPRDESRSQFSVVEPSRIRSVLDDACEKEPFEWWYRGHAARYFRAVTLPRLAQSARRSDSSRRVNVQLLDPTSRSAQEYYFRYRRSLRSAIRDPWTLDRASIEICATIVSMLAWREEVASLDINVRLGTVVSPLTIDMCSTQVVITQEGLGEAALRFDASSIFYRAYREDLRMSFEQARPLKLPDHGVRFEDLTVQTVRRLLGSLEFIGDLMSDDASIEAIVERVRKPRDPYA